MPEGYCRNYAGATAASCPRRFPQPGDATTREGPRGRDYYGGDLTGITKKLDYLQTSASPRSTSTRSSSRSRTTATTRATTSRSPVLRQREATSRSWSRRRTSAGMRVILDGVFNHMSSDSPFFDRYHHYTETGACESARLAVARRGSSSTTRPRARAAAPTTTAGSASTRSRCCTKSRADVQSYFLTGKNSVTRDVAQARRGRLAARRLRRRVVPGRLLGDVPQRRQERPTRTR